MAKEIEVTIRVNGSKDTVKVTRRYDNDDLNTDIRLPGNIAHSCYTDNAPEAIREALKLYSQLA